MPLDIFLLVIIACYTAVVFIAMRYMYKAMKMVREATGKVVYYHNRMLAIEDEKTNIIFKIKDFATQFNAENYNVKLEWDDDLWALYVTEENNKEEE